MFYKWSVLASALILFSCGSSSTNHEEPAPSAEESCRASPGKVWNNGICQVAQTTLTEQQICEQDAKKIWVDGSCQNRPSAPERHALKAADLTGAWKTKDCTLGPVGTSWQTTILNIGSNGNLNIQVLLYPTSSCQFYEDRMEYGGTFEFDETLQKLAIAYTHCKYVYKQISGETQKEKDCSSDLTHPQTFEITATSATHMTMNTLIFDKL